MERPPSPVFMKLQNEADVPLEMMLGLEEAFRAIADSPTAKKILEKAVSDGVELVYDPALGRDLMAAAGYNPLKNTIFFSDFTDDPLLLATTLVHEARHADQIRSGGLKIDSSYTPASMLKMALAVEADVRAYELKVAFELAVLNDKNGEPRWPDSLDAVLFKLRELPGIEKIVARGVDHPQTLENGQLMAECFKEFYNSAWLREAYEDHMLLMIQSFPAAMTDEKMHTKEASSAEIMKSLINPDAPYVRDNLKEVDLDDDHHASVRPQSVLKLDFLKAVRGQHTNYRKEPGWAFKGTYEADGPMNDPSRPPGIKRPKPPSL